LGPFMATLSVPPVWQASFNSRYTVTIHDLAHNRKLDQKEMSAVTGDGWFGAVVRRPSTTTVYGVDGESTEDRHRGEIVVG
jgi:hypothetical protein